MLYPRYGTSVNLKNNDKEVATISTHSGGTYDVHQPDEDKKRDPQVQFAEKSFLDLSSSFWTDIEAVGVRGSSV